MPSAPPQLPEVPHFVSQYDTATEFLKDCIHILRTHEESCVVMFAHALGRIEDDSVGHLSNRHRGETSGATVPRRKEAFWLTVWSIAGNTPPILDLVLMCDRWILGDYPIFLWSPYHESQLDPSWLSPRVDQLTRYLFRCVPRERVFAVFGKAALSKEFAAHWSHLASMPTAVDPIYDAILTRCTAETFKDGDGEEPPVGHIVRLAQPQDLIPVTLLCEKFADDSVYYPLSRDDAKVEAMQLIERQQIWVYEVDKTVAAICAAAREGHNATVISKVFTKEELRNQGYAERLVRQVTRHLLFTRNKAAVVLYVGHRNKAQSVYNRVGYAGLCGLPRPPTVEDWLELGFRGGKMGHW
ncbi:hypothetical protein HGRIS_008317 [Hohenbuehelia grisea]|uniref:N-acetyltransferase domain-containing protein n=1 Tax=Hohenbuehelia grisea TaxID=104357 RepID=A0ABR3J7S0_9AGAR